MQKTRLRIRFSKTGDLRWISHRDLARVWERLLRRSNLSLAFSEGFHPKPKISFPSALALGIEALEEVVELELQGSFDLTEVEHCIRGQMLDGMDLLSIEAMAPGSPKAHVVASQFRLVLPEVFHSRVAKRIVEILEQPTLQVERDGKTVVVQTTDPHFQIRIHGEHLHFTLPSTQQGAMRPSEMLKCLGLADFFEQGALLQRVELILDCAAQGPVSADGLCAKPLSEYTTLPD